MKEYLDPTRKGRVALALVVLYCAGTIWAGKSIPDLYPPLSSQGPTAVDQILNRVFHSSLYATIVVIPPALIIGWLHCNSLKTLKWPSLGPYVPFRVRVRTLKGTKMIWVSLIVAEAHLLLIVIVSWFHYFHVRDTYASYGLLGAG